MHLYINLLGRNIPSYGLCIVIGGVVTNIIAYYILKKKDFDIDDFILMETYGFLGAFIGAKGLYLLVSINEIDWNRFFQYKYFLTLMEGGFVFYGGIIGAIIFAYISSRIYSIYFWNYFKEVLFLLPLGHAFGRIGCFMAGCCYGVPYDGVISVVFPENSFAIHGISLFPVQLVEAAGLVVISFVIFCIYNLFGIDIGLESYMLLYGTFRLVLENYRYDDYRGYFLLLSTSQWISIILIIVAIKSLGIKMQRRGV